MKTAETAATIKRGSSRATMLAVRIQSYGGPEVLKYEEVPKPEPGAGEILVKVHAAGVNPIDWKVREGYFKQMVNYKLPLIPGWDFSGEVDTLGPDTGRFEQGDEVFGKADSLRDGAYAEYLVIRESDAAYKPKSTSHVEAAALPTGALTAWQALFDTARLQEGQSVLIHAAAGGVGHFAVQLAKWEGTTVIGTASQRNLDFIQQLGVDKAIDYHTMKFEDVVKNVDVVLDTIGGDTQKRSWKVLKKGGILVSIVSPPSQQEADAKGAHQAFIRARINASQLGEIAELVDDGEIGPTVETVLPLSEARHAQQLSQAGHIRGKIVLKIV